MNTTVKGFAKINLFLDITGVRDDGYHDIRGVFQSIDLYDTIHVKTVPGGVTVRGVDGVDEEKNSAYKAAMFFKRHYGMPDGLKIDIEKGIPVAGGLGGSSADGAAVLKALFALYEREPGSGFYRDVAYEVGADIPFLFTGGLALVEGIGEKINPLKGHLKKALIVGNPGVEVDTGWAYKAASFLLTPHYSTCKILLRCLTEVDYDAWNDALYNRFEDIVFNEYPQVSQLKTEFLENGAKAALMSGSGSSVFALFDTVEEAERAYAGMRDGWRWMRLVAAN